MRAKTRAERPGDFTSFEEFRRHYLGEHANLTNRTLHVAGTAAALTLAGVAVTRRRPWLLLLAPVVGHGRERQGHEILIVPFRNGVAFGGAIAYCRGPWDALG